MKKISIILSILIFGFSLTYCQDTIVGWTFPNGHTLPLSDFGNANNKGNMYFEAVRINEIPFGTINLTKPGLSSSCASIAGWDTSILKKAWKLSVDATNYGSMKLYARLSSDSTYPGPRDFKIQYQNGCCDPVWHDIPAAIVRAGSDWVTGFINGLEIPSACNNMSGLHLRILITSDTSTDGVLLKHDGISMIDNIYVTGTGLNGIDENIHDQVKIFPNPSDGLFNITSGDAIKGIIITDQLGRMVFNRKINQYKIGIDLKNQIKGIYMIIIETEKTIVTRKINLF
jgi:hypothetical protein